MEQQNPIVKWPFGSASVEPLAASGDTTIEVVNTLTIADGRSVVATGDRTINVTIDPELEIGSRLVVMHKPSATENLTPGEGLKGDVITSEAVVEFIYDGVSFVQAGSSKSVEPAKTDY